PGSISRPVATAIIVRCVLFMFRLCIIDSILSKPKSPGQLFRPILYKYLTYQQKEPPCGRPLSPCVPDPIIISVRSVLFVFSVIQNNRNCGQSNRACHPQPTQRPARIHRSRGPCGGTARGGLRAT